jgi:hypothetical protein
LVVTFRRYAVLQTRDVVLALWIVMFLLGAITVADLGDHVAGEGLRQDGIAEMFPGSRASYLRQQHLVGGAVPQHRSGADVAIDEADSFLRRMTRTASQLRTHRQTFVVRCMVTTRATSLNGDAGGAAIGKLPDTVMTAASKSGCGALCRAK